MKMEELLNFFVLMFVGPYIIGPPIAFVWVTIAFLVRYLTGWSGLLPADCWIKREEIR